MEKRVHIIEVRGDVATVKVEQQNACETCSVNSACGTSVLSGLFTRNNEYDVVNTSNAKVGDEAILSVSDAVLLKVSVAMYLFPLLSLFAGAIVTESMFGNSGFTEAASILGGLTGFFLGIYCYKYYAKHLQACTQNMPVVISHSQHSNRI